MKTLSTLRIILYLMAGLSLAGCGKKEEPKPAPKSYAVSLRVTGQNLQGLGADISYATAKNHIRGPYGAGPTGTEAFAATASKTFDLGRLGPEDLVEGYVNFRNVRATTTPRPPATAVLKMEIIVDGRVHSTGQITGAGPAPGSGYNPHLQGYVALETENL
ncbi:hypothetical protein [Hymenobacter koreensis]|uniref:Lipoprotein n=1 Tax=Hymenobacter koreensis TaxID=1084523 RepID=A0ABP8JNA9_9BACT